MHYITTAFFNQLWALYKREKKRQAPEMPEFFDFTT